MPDQTPSMPPLPKSVAHLHSNGDFCQDVPITSSEWPVHLYTAEQVQAVADERVREALELAAKLADSTHPAYRDRIGTAIRALARPTPSLDGSPP